MNLVTKPFGTEVKSTLCPYCGGKKEITQIKSTGVIETVKCGSCNHEGRILRLK